jgi:hypothetical protein
MTYLIIGLVVIIVVGIVEIFFIKVGGKPVFGTEDGYFDGVGRFVANLLKKIFPPANEITVFVITVTILSMFIYMDGWFDNTIMMASEVIENYFRSIDESDNFKDTAIAHGSFIVLLLFLVLSIFGPLFLPFNKKDLRGLCLIMIFAHAIIIAYTNLTLDKESPSFINAFIVLYSIVWIVYLYVVTEMRKQDHLMSNQQAKAVPSFIAASVSALAVFLAIKLFSVPWYRAYSVGAIIVANLVALGSAQFYRSLFHEQEK